MLVAYVALTFIDTSPSATVLGEWLRRRGDSKSLTVEVERLRRRNLLLRWHVNWGRQRPEVAQLSDDDLALVTVEIARLDATLNTLGRSLDAIVEEMLAPLHRLTKEDANYWVGAYFNDHVWQPTRRNLALVRFPQGTDGEPDEDPRAALKALLENYDELRVWLGRLARIQSRQIVSYAGFADWQTADGKLYEKLRDLPNVPALQEMRHAVASHNQQRRSPDDLRLLTSAIVPPTSAARGASCGGNRFMTNEVSVAKTPGARSECAKKNDPRIAGRFVSLQISRWRGCH